MKLSVAGADYVGQTVNLLFMRGSSRQCHLVTILDNDLCRLPQENFFADLVGVNGHRHITINIPTTQIVVDNSDDRNQLECGEYDCIHIELATTL